MIFGTFTSWLTNEIIASIVLLLCIAHILKKEQPMIKLLELFCYMITAGIFENIGVWQNVYYYSHERLMMFGNVPFSILFIEGVILYTTFELMRAIKVPKWVIPFGAGLLSSIQDMTLDPSSIYDLHLVNGVMEGQWNWTKHYDGGFVGIPFFNFSGWFTMILFFSAFILIGRHMYQKNKKPWFGVAYPFISIILTIIALASPINQFLLYAVPFVSMNTKYAELIMLIFNFSISIFLILKFAKYDKPFNMKEDGILFGMPIFLHIYALVSSIALGITSAILPIIIVMILHLGFLYYAYKRLKVAKSV